MGKDTIDIIKQLGGFGRADGKLTVMLDFDGTLVEHRFPAMGTENPGWHQVVSKLQAAGHRIILNTYRTDIMADRYKAKAPVDDKNPDHLEEAVAWLQAKMAEYGLGRIELGGLKMNPAAWSLQHTYLQLHNILFLDDQALNAPMKAAPMGGLMLDWEAVDVVLESWGCYQPI